MGAEVIGALLLLALQEERPVDFYGEVQPVLAVHCHRCHGPDSAKGGLRLDRAELLAKGGDSGAPAIAEILRRVAAEDGDRMPPKGPSLSGKEIDSLRRWATAGAPWPERDDYWAFQPPQDVEVPDGPSDHPIDRFVNARLAEAGLSPAPEADRRTLLRRAYADLIGIWPSPQEAAAFLDDRSPGAWERLIERLLADPRYGERWARHWLDLARYAESDGYEDDKIRPLAWRYRDYVVRSFNAGKPYDRFVQEQVAGDELFPDDPDAWIATGFARLGPWDGMSKEPDRQRQDFLNDVTDTAGSVFLGMTVGCARCHDHKYDRITQEDYFALQAFFAGTRRETREIRVEDAPAIREAWTRARAASHAARSELEALRREAQERLLHERRCDVRPDGTVKVDEGDVIRFVDHFHPGRRGELEAEIRENKAVERLHHPAAEAVFETSAQAPDTYLLRGGQIEARGPVVRPRFIEAMCAPGQAVPDLRPGATTGRRSALARWLTSPDHPLTARVMVNRIWQQHFGRGLVSTSSDFGRNGERPSHPALLDWLARDFVRQGWSLKAMHRRIMTSAAYRRSSGPGDARLLQSRSIRRLDAEAIRDSLLAASGRLNPAKEGPGVYAPIPPEINVMLPNNDKELSWGRATDEEGRRRSIYIFQRRSLTYPLIEVFDGADMNETCPQRAETTVAPQALALMNSVFARESARHFAERVARAPDAVDAAFRIAYARGPSAAERARADDFLSRRPLADLCHVLLNANEFIYVD